MRTENQYRLSLPVFFFVYFIHFTLDLLSKSLKIASIE